jgi:hypothetical protein
MLALPPPPMCRPKVTSTSTNTDVEAVGLKKHPARAQQWQKIALASNPNASHNGRGGGGTMVPLERFELPTLALRKPCSTPELQRRLARIVSKLRARLT